MQENRFWLLERRHIFTLTPRQQQENDVESDNIRTIDFSFGCIRVDIFVGVFAGNTATDIMARYTRRQYFLVKNDIFFFLAAFHAWIMALSETLHSH